MKNKMLEAARKELLQLQKTRRLDTAVSRGAEEAHKLWQLWERQKTKVSYREKLDVRRLRRLAIKTWEQADKLAQIILKYE